MSKNVSTQNSSQNPQHTDNVPGANAGFDTNDAKNREEPLRFTAPTHGGVDILKLLTELEDLVENTKHGPLGILFGFPEDQFHMTIMKIRANLPEEMKRASKLVREQERIVEETREGAERIKEEARLQALADYERRKAEAEQLCAQANAEAARTRTAVAEEAAQLRARIQAELDRVRGEAETEAKTLIEATRLQGEEIISEARAQAARLVHDSDIVQQAQMIAQDLMMRAEQEADGVRMGADDYARTVLANLEGVLGKAVTQIQRGRELLESPR